MERVSYLSELWLSIGAEILISKAFGKLDIFINTTSHQNLFVLLRTLR